MDDHDSGLDNLDKNYPDWNLTQQAFQEYADLSAACDLTGHLAEV
ncbi:MAG TPA: hypothetical protein VGL24_04900 [Chthoniobacterales bacterium]|jgi:hypothetical protein